MRARWGLPMLLCGCTALFGLELPPNGDGDSDGIVDDLDNCPQNFNPDQSNFDGDDVGDVCDECFVTSPDVDNDGTPDPCDGCIGNGTDVDGDSIDDNCECVVLGQDGDADGTDDGCDPCLLGPQDDEDADGIFDACDNCPGIPNQLQENVQDTDGVGDACDAWVGESHRLFDNFLTDSTEWFQEGSGWARVGGLYQVDTAGRPASFRSRGEETGDLRILTAGRFLDAIGGPTFDGSVELFASESQSLVDPQEVRCFLTTNGLITITSSGAYFSSSTAIDVYDGFTLMLDVYTKKQLAVCTATDRMGRMATAATPIEPQQRYYASVMANNWRGELRFWDVIGGVD